MKEKEEKTTSLASPLPIRIMVGEKYRFVVDNQITTARIEKIYTENGESYVLITVKKPKSINCFNFFPGTHTSAIRVCDFKVRLVTGGLSDLEI